jgi:hypothetical protein
MASNGFDPSGVGSAGRDSFSARNWIDRKRAWFRTRSLAYAGLFLRQDAREADWTPTVGEEEWPVLQRLAANR